MPSKRNTPKPELSRSALSILSLVVGAISSALSAIFLILYIRQKRQPTLETPPPSALQPSSTSADVPPASVEKPTAQPPITTPPLVTKESTPIIRNTPASPQPINTTQAKPRIWAGFAIPILVICFGLLFFAQVIFNLDDWFGWDTAWLKVFDPVACLWPVVCSLRLPPYSLVAFAALIIAAVLFAVGLTIFRSQPIAADLQIAPIQSPDLRRLLTPVNLGLTLAFIGIQVYVGFNAYYDQPIHPLVWSVGLLILLWLTWQATTSKPTVKAWLKEDWLSDLAFLLGLATLLVALAGFVSQHYLALGGAAGLTVVLLWAGVGRRWPQWDWPNRLERIALIGLTLSSFSLMSYGLNSWNWSFWGDEYAFYEMAKNFADGVMAEPWLSGAGAYGYHAVMSSVWTGAFMWLLGPDGYGWRVSHSFLLAFTIPFFYYFLRPMLGRPWALAAVVLYGCSHLLLSFGKLGSNNAQALIFLPMALAAWWWSARRGSWPGLVLTGLIIGAGFYTFAMARVYGLLIAIWLMLYYFPFHFRRPYIRWSNWVVWLAVIGPALLTAIPVLSTRAAWEGQLRQTIATSEVAFTFADKVTQFVINSVYTFTALFYNNQNAISVYGAHADPITASLFVLGLATLFATWRQGWRPRLGLLASYVALGIMAGSIQQYNYPSITRLFVLVPFYATFAAFGLWGVYALLRTALPPKSAKTGVWAGFGLVLIGVIVLNIWESVGLSQQRLEQKVPAFYLQTAQLTAKPNGDGPPIYYIGPPSGDFWLDTIFSVHDVPADRARLVVERDALNSKDLCEAGAGPAILIANNEISDAAYITSQIQNCWPGSDLKLIKDARGNPRLYRLMSAQALLTVKPVSGYWREEEPPTAEIAAPPPSQQQWQVYQPRGLAVAPNGQVVAVEAATASILFFNETGNIDQVLKGIFVYPSDAGFTSAGDLVIADANEGILIFNADRQLISQINSFSSPRGLFVAPDDTLYVAETGKGRIAHVTLAGDLIESFTNPELYPQPTSVAVAPDGRIAIGDPVVGQVVVLDSTGQLLAQYPISPGDSSDAKPGVMWLADGGLMYTDPQVGKLVWVGNDGQAIQEWTELRRPNDLAQGVDGTIYVLESGQNRITKFTLP